MLLPFFPPARELAFVALPLAFFLFSAAPTAIYLVLVELVKRRLMRRIAG